MDHFNDLMDSQADAFYDNIRALVVVFLIISLLLPVSYVVIAYLRDLEESALSKDDLSINRFVIGVCTLSLSVSLLMYLMLPFSIFANEVLLVLPDSYYVQWINTALLTNLFFSVAISSKFVCILVPFCFFLLSSHSVFHGKKAVTSRFMDSSVYLIICFIAYFGCLATLVATFLLFVSLPEHLSSSTTVADILPRFSCSSQTICLSLFHCLGRAFCCFDTALVIIQRTVSSAGLVLLLICMPFGVIRILLWALTSSVALPSAPGATSAFGGTTEAVDRLYQAKNNTCWSYISKVNLPFSPAPNLYDPISQKYFPYKDLVPTVTSEPQFLDADFTQLAYLEDVYFQSCNTMDKLKRPSSGHRSVCSFVVLTLLVVLLIVGTAYTTANIFVLLFGLVFGYNKALNLSPTSSISYDISIGRESASKFGWIGAILQILLVTYVTCTSLFGLYSLPISQRHLLPRPHGTPMAKLLANVICILLMSSALPLQTSLLGLAEPSFPYHYSISLGGSFCRPSNEVWDPSAPACTQSSVATTSQAFAVIAPAGSPQCASPSYNLATEASSLPSTSIVGPVAANTRELLQQQYSPQASPEDGRQTRSSPATGPTPVYTPNAALAVAQQHLRATSPDASEEGRVMAASLGNLSLTAMLTFVYLGLDPRSYSLLVALFYNIGFLATCYWLFRQHVHTLTQLLHSQVYYKFAVRFLPRFMYLERRSPGPLVIGHHRHHE